MITMKRLHMSERSHCCGCTYAVDCCLSTTGFASSMKAVPSGSGQTCSPRGAREAEGRLPDDAAVRSGQLWLQMIATWRRPKDPARKVGVTGRPAPPATRSAAVSAMISHGRSTTCGQYPAPARSGIDGGSRLTAPVQRQGSPMPWRLMPTSCQRRFSATAIPRRRALRL